MTTSASLTERDVRRILHDGFARAPIDGRRVLVIVPDGTRTMPMAMMFSMLEETLAQRASALDVLVALGTHQPMSDDQLSAHLGRQVQDGRAGATRVLNHRWEDPSAFVSIGAIAADEVSALTGGLIAKDVDVTVNRLLLEYDHLVVCGPVFPHEVAGFSGGTKYFVPGVAGPAIIDFTHWLGAMHTSAATIGTIDTPVRAVIDRAAALIPRPATCVSAVVAPGPARPSLAGLFVGPPGDSWRAAAELSSRIHVVCLERPVSRVLAIMPPMYTDLWTAAKGMYKVEPAVDDGGEVVIFAPHITNVSHTHGRLLEEIGYHCRDYFVRQWDRFGAYPGGVLAHSTHLRGAGTYDGANGIERCRIDVTLATGISEDRCRRLNLGYRDPSMIRIGDWEGREDEGVLVVRRAGELLYKVATRCC